MTNKELKRAHYIYLKEQAGVILSSTEKEYIDEHRDEYLSSQIYKEQYEMTDVDAQVLKKAFRVPDGVDTKEFFMETRKNAIRKKFANKLWKKEENRDGE